MRYAVTDYDIAIVALLITVELARAHHDAGPLIGVRGESAALWSRAETPPSVVLFLQFPALNIVHDQIAQRNVTLHPVFVAGDY